MMSMVLVLFVCVLGISEADECCSTTCKKHKSLENIALQGRATQSSRLLNKDGFLASAMNAIDGNLESNVYLGSCSHTDPETNPWWRVDLLRSYAISFILITNRGECCAERLDGAEIHIGDSLENNGNNNPRCTTISSIPLGATYTFPCSGMVGRYVNIFLPGENKMLSLCEVQVYGYPVY
ncbi:fucolectin-like isoform X2 [Protopterus annectens]|nr:fucolectin-like isoform X2 [Protopterus annectens]